MKRQFGRVARVAFALSLLTALIPGAAFATHGTNPPNTHDVKTVNMAGRPINSTAGTPWDAFCHGIAYGRVNGNKVLFVPRHCWNGWDRDGNEIEDGWEADGDEDIDSYDQYSDGELVWDTNGNYIGIWREPSATAAYDLAYIQLGAYVWPSNPHQIYSGVNPSTGATLWRTITYERPPAALSCSGLDDLVNTTIYNSFNMTWNSTYYNRIGLYDSFDSNGGGGNCRMWSNIPAHCNSCAIDSGSPLHINGYAGVPVAFAHVKEGGDGSDLIYKPLYHGMAALHDLYHPQYGGGGAYFCTSSSCPAIY